MVAHLQPLAGVRVLDLSRLLPGPYATWLLRRLGAEVIRVEAAGLVDYARAFPPFVGEDAALFHVINRGKRSIALDLKRPEGRAALLRLVAGCDVLFEQFRPGVLDRLGLDAATLRGARPDLIIARLTGYGQTGPLRDAAGHDLNYQALAGSLWMSGPADAPPPVPPLPTADLSGALHAVIAIQGALLARPAGGADLDVAMADALGALAAPLVAGWTGDPTPPGRGGGDLCGGLAQYRVYACRDGHLAVGALEPKFWAAFCSVAGHPEWAEQPAIRGAHQPPLIAAVAAVVATRSRAEWAAALDGVDCCVSVVLDPKEAMAHPHWAARGVRGHAATDGAQAAWCEPWPGVDDRAVPRHGQDADALLAEAGYGAEEIAELRASGAVE